MVSKKKATIMCIISGICFSVLTLIIAVMLFTGSFWGINDGLFTKIKHIREIGETASIIENTFYKDIDINDVFNSGSRAMINSLEDKYARFYTTEEYLEFQNSLKGVYNGVGVVIEVLDDGKVRIANVYEDSPAERADIKIDDIILNVNGTKTTGMAAEDIIALFKQDLDKPIKVTLERLGVEYSVELVNEEIKTKKVHFKTLDNDITYIKIDEFQGDDVQGFKDAVEFAKTSNAKGIVIDLRNNPGGNLFDVVAIADLLLPQGPVISIKPKNGKVDTLYSDEEALGLPMSVLINKNSASGSEALAGAIQDYEAGVIVGETSFGKGIVQTTYPLISSGAHVKLTTATYLTPKNREIHEQGIIPDIFSKMDDNTNVPYNIEEIGKNKDKQLDTALEIVKKLINTKEGS